MKICIIGGGTTGWWAAKYLEQKNHWFDKPLRFKEAFISVLDLISFQKSLDLKLLFSKSSLFFI